jgi:hypothetical protein
MKTAAVTLIKNPREVLFGRALPAFTALAAAARLLGVGIVGRVRLIGEERTGVLLPSGGGYGVRPYPYIGVTRSSYLMRF